LLESLDLPRSGIRGLAVPGEVEQGDEGYRSTYEEQRRTHLDDL
jgi:hypothetical protein